LEVQKALADRSSDTAGALLLRIGINLGDIIIEEDGDIYGDGVNIAARLEQLAAPGGICVSGSVFDQIEGKIEKPFEYRGDQTVKNIARPVRIYARGDRPEADVASPPLPPLPLPGRPSIAVVPFSNLGGDPEQDYFADGVVEDIITALSRVRWFFVIARNSSFSYKGRAVDVRQIGRELGVRYVLEGSVRRAGHRLRITGQLIEAATGRHVWADRFDGDLTDIFDLQDRITESVVGAIEPTVRRAEIDRSRGKRPEDLDAYDLYLRAVALMYEIQPEGRVAALSFVEKALDIDPGYAEAHGVAAWLYFARSLWEGGLPAPYRDAMLRHARAVQELRTEDASTVSHAAIALALATRDYAAGQELIDRAIALNPNSVHAYGHGSVINTWAGEYRKAVALAERALRLSPFDPLSVMPLAGKAGALMMLGDYESSLTYARRGLQAYPNHTPSFLISIVDLMRLGRIDEARLLGKRFMELAPSYRIIPQAPVLEHFRDELRAAGLPE
jgi:adenylate cyclase